MTERFDFEAAAWDPQRAVAAGDVALLDDLIAGAVWDGPLIVSMPRTGSTLLGTLMLLLRDPPGSGRHVFRRYLHEPVAPMFWEGRSIDDVIRAIGGRLESSDVVQESAYQFTDKVVARWFLHRARRPVAFTIRDPRLAWPSRWRIMLRMRLEAGVPDADEQRIRAALESRDYSHLGDLLTEEVEPPGNGWCSFVSLIELCRDEGIDHVLVDNGRLRADPDGVLADLCERWGLAYDPALTQWDDLSEAIPRVVMSDLASGPEYEWYYENTLSSRDGIRRTDRDPLDVARFPAELRGPAAGLLTIDDAVAIYRQLLEELEVVG